MFNKNQRTIQIPDLVLSERDGSFTALYITGKDLLDKDNPNEIGCPFFFYTGEYRELIKRFQKDGTPYRSRNELDKLLENAQLISWMFPKDAQIKVSGIKLEELVQFVKTPKGDERVYVPYGLEIFGYDDKGMRRMIRSKDSYRQMVQRTLPSVMRERAKREFYSHLTNYPLALLKLRKPSKIPTENPITYAYCYSRE